MGRKIVLSKGKGNNKASTKCKAPRKEEFHKALTLSFTIALSNEEKEFREHLFLRAAHLLFILGKMVSK